MVWLCISNNKIDYEHALKEYCKTNNIPLTYNHNIMGHVSSLGDYIKYETTTDEKDTEVESDIVDDTVSYNDFVILNKII